MAVVKQRVTLAWCQREIAKVTRAHQKLDLQIVSILHKARHNLAEDDFDSFKEWCIHNYRILFPSVVAFDCYLAVADELLPTAALDLISFGGGSYMRDGIRLVRAGKMKIDDFWAVIQGCVKECDLKKLRKAVGRDRKLVAKKAASTAVFKCITAVRQSTIKALACILELDDGTQVAVRKRDARRLRKFL